MAQHFDKLSDCIKFIEQLNSFGMEPTQELLSERARLEALENINQDEFIFSTMKVNNPFMTEEKEHVIREMTDQLMSTADNAAQPCLLLGKVQCGKTDTFQSIMGLCFDRGIDIAVVLTKPTTTLANQTISRLQDKKKAFGLFSDKGTYNQKVVITIWDILDLYKRGGLSDYQLNDPANKFIIVAKKENTNLQYLNELFENSELLRNKKVLVCDDEADFASRNYYQRKGEISLMRIAEHIENFIKLPRFCRYLQITATPYSLYLQPDGSIQLRSGMEASPWLPRYTGLVPIHSKYIGGRQYFELSEDENSMYSCLFQEVDDDCMDILSARNEWYLQSKVHSNNLTPLNYAVVSYMFASAVRSIQQKKKSNQKYKSSCLIHCEIAKRNHQWQADLITEIIEDIKNAFLKKANSDLHILDLEREAYESLKYSNELGNKYELITEKFPSFAEVEAEVKRILEYNDYVIKVVNSEEPGKVETMIDSDPDSPSYGRLKLDQSLNFFIGGSILDRGITIDNMLCFFYGRDPKKFQMDTVLQHARMYGARAKEDMACTRFFTTIHIYDVLQTINAIDSLMYDYLKAHRDTVQTDDFTSMVIGWDPRINAAASNKYTPANTKVLKPKQRILPVGFQTGDPEEVKDAVERIDELIQSCADYQNATEDEPFFMMPCETAAEIIRLIESTLRYGVEYENIDYEWDANEMLTALEHCTFGSDGMIYCLHRKGRNMSRERELSQKKKGRWIDAPDDGRGDTAPSREIATDRPVLMLLEQNGYEENGWRNARFYWPVFVVQQYAVPGIFTINSNKKFKAPKKQLKLAALDNYDKSEILFTTVSTEVLMVILAKAKNTKEFDIKRTTCSLFLEKDILGNYILVEGTDPNKYYNLASYNDGVFPYEIKDYKYIFMKNSMDFSGSQALIKLDADNPYKLIAEQKSQSDFLFSDHNDGELIRDESLCKWSIEYKLSDIIEQMLTPQDEEYLKLVKSQIAEDELNTKFTDCEETYIEQ